MSVLKAETRNETHYRNLEVIMGTTSRCNKYKYIAGTEGGLFFSGPYRWSLLVGYLIKKSISDVPLSFTSVVFSRNGETVEKSHVSVESVCYTPILQELSSIQEKFPEFLFKTRKQFSNI